MPTFIFLEPDGTETSIDVEVGANAMRVAVAHGIDGILAECGGSMLCATCHVGVLESVGGELPERSDTEDEMLDFTATARTSRSRLACQLEAVADEHRLVLEIAGEQ